MKLYNLVKTNPVARFYYKGTHSHPIRRTVLVIENTRNLIIGYELREGSIVRKFSEAPVKSYNKNKIAKYKQLHVARRAKVLEKNPVKKYESSTMNRASLWNLIVSGP